MRLRSFALYALAFLALTSLLAGAALGADRHAEAWLSERIDPEPSSTPRKNVRSTRPEARVAASPAGPTELPPAAAALAPSPLLVTVPDVDGMSVARARRTLRELGLRLRARDEFGYAIPRGEAAYYHVDGDRLRPTVGSQVEPGTEVRVVAEPERQLFSGY